MHTDLPSLVAVVGPTASGKTALGEFLALQFNGEIVSADAKQVYRGMDLGTAKELNLRVPQYLIDIKNPGEKITAAEYQQLAYGVIDRLLAQGKQPFLVGGSMMYIDGVMQGYEFKGEGHTGKIPRYRGLYIGRRWSKDELQQRAHQRLAARLEQGLVDEVKGLLHNGVDANWLWHCGIEYKFITAYLQETYTYKDAILKIEYAINQYIKRQYTWWRHHGNVVWVDSEEMASRVVEAFLAGHDVV
jgi:tRNA dimethylallyltransferase